MHITSPRFIMETDVAPDLGTRSPMVLDANLHSLSHSSGHEIAILWPTGFGFAIVRTIISRVMENSHVLCAIIVLEFLLSGLSEIGTYA